MFFHLFYSFCSMYICMLCSKEKWFWWIKCKIWKSCFLMINYICIHIPKNTIHKAPLSPEVFPQNITHQKIFNKNTMKVCYSSMANVASTINAHNKKTWKRRETEDKTSCKPCNCRRKDQYPITGDSQLKSIIHNVEIQNTCINKRKMYLGINRMSTA